MSTKAQKEANRLRQAAFVERWARLGFAAVRGIMAHVDDHARIKAYARKLNKARMP